MAERKAKKIQHKAAKHLNDWEDEDAELLC